MAQVRTDATLQIIVDTLLATAAVQAVVGNRVQGGWARDSDLGTIPKPAIVVLPDGGDPDPSGAWAQLLIEVHAVSADGSSPALSLYELVHEALNGQELCHATNDHRAIGWEVDRPRIAYVRDAGCWTAVGRWQVTAIRKTYS